MSEVKWINNIHRLKYQVNKWLEGNDNYLTSLESIVLPLFKLNAATRGSMEEAMVDIFSDNPIIQRFIALL